MRLIDADALKQAVPEAEADIFENCRNCTCMSTEQVKELINNAPTIMADESMTEQDVDLLKKALELYSFTIEQRREDRYDVFEVNEFFTVKSKLSKIIGVDVT